MAQSEYLCLERRLRAKPPEEHPPDQVEQVPWLDVTDDGVTAISLRELGRADVQGQIVAVAVLAKCPRLIRLGGVVPAPLTDA